MKIILMGTAFAPERYGDWHLISAVDVPQRSAPEAEPGAHAGRHSFTRLPEWIAHDRERVRTREALAEFRAILDGFIDRNRTTIGARKVVINLNGKAQPLPFDYVKAIWEVFRQKAALDPIEVVVFANLTT